MIFPHRDALRCQSHKSWKQPAWWTAALYLQANWRALPWLSQGLELLSGEQFEPSSSPSHAASLSAHLARNQEPSAWELASVKCCRPVHPCGLVEGSVSSFNKDYYNTCPQIRLAPGTEPLYCFTAHSEGLTSIKRTDKCVIITSQLIRWEPNTLCVHNAYFSMIAFVDVSQQRLQVDRIYVFFFLRFALKKVNFCEFFSFCPFRDIIEQKPTKIPLNLK